jgi:hypothetical protein
MSLQSATRAAAQQVVLDKPRHARDPAHNLGQNIHYGDQREACRHQRGRGRLTPMNLGNIRSDFLAAVNASWLKPAKPISRGPLSLRTK